jgi:hypothetical protein
MRKTFTVDVAMPLDRLIEIAQEAGDRTPKWRRNGDLSWKFGSELGLKAPGKANATVIPGEGELNTLQIEIKRRGLVDLWGFLKNDYRDFYDEFERLLKHASPTG